MENYTSDQLRALLAGELSAEQESAIADALERDPALLDRLERLTGSGFWLKGGYHARMETSSPSLDSAIERVVSESRIEWPSAMRSGSESFDNEVNAEEGNGVDSMDLAIAVPGIRIVREIGRGGMGIVYEGWDENVGRKVAIKQLLPMRGSAQNAKERLLQEARAAGSLLHPNIVSIYGVHFHNQMPVLVQQYVEGETLQERIDSKRYLTWQECVETAKQIASGLEAAHSAGIVHRDLKPDNILIETSTNVVRIADFGIAKQSMVTGLTATDKIAGTPAYMSPEQTAGEVLDARSDLFSLGSVLVAAVTGVPPFGQDDPFVVMDRIRTQDSKRLSDVLRNCPPWLDNIVDSLLRKDRTRRIASATELIAALQFQSSPRIEFNKKRTKATFVLGIGLVAICAILFLSFQAIEKQPWADRQQTAEPASINPSATSPLGDFVPSKALWIRRDRSEYDSLSDAIESAIDGDVIEIGADLACDPITIRGKKLTLRGTAAVRPVLRSANEKTSNENTDGFFIRTESDLTLEGVEIQWVAVSQIPFFDERRLNAVVGAAPGTRLTIDRCKIVRSAGGVCLATGGHLEMRRTIIEGASIALAWFGLHSQAVVEDSILDGRMGIAIMYPLANVTVYSRSNLKIRNCTIRAVDAISAMLTRRPDEPVSIQLQDTLFDTGHTVSLMSLSTNVRDQIETQPIPALNSCIEISEARCIYDKRCEFLVTRRIKSIERASRTRVSGLEQWLAICSKADTGHETRSIVAKMTRIAHFADVPSSNAYQFEATSENSLPSWIDQVGPTSTSLP